MLFSWNHATLNLNGLAAENHPSSSESNSPDEVALLVRGILSNRCFACHGPDEAQREAGLRLDQADTLLKEADSGDAVILVGDPDQSELVRRIESADPDLRMPPDHFGKALTSQEQQLVRIWIKQGANLPKHWSFVSPGSAQPPSIPDEVNSEAVSPDELRDWQPELWEQHPVDRFVLKKQIELGMHPSRQAERTALLRRLALDLTGLPPTLDEIGDFVADREPGAYERQVDRLLASPRFGEHWARQWLDLARYADSAGYADDPPRTIWAYRDWVIRAMNSNQPIDQFSIEQIAGDLLENPTPDQLIATAFHRNTLTNNEGGTNDEEFRNVAVVDRVNTTMAVWMGVTMACAQCHTHKYDPFTHEEYFKLFAIFNQTRDADRKDESPTIPVYSRETLARRSELQSRLVALNAALDNPSQDIDKELERWEASLREPEWSALRPLEFNSRQKSSSAFTADRSIAVSPLANNIVSDTYTVQLEIDARAPLQALGIRTVPQADLPGKGAGLGASGLGKGNFVVTDIRATLRPKEANLVKARFVRIENPGREKILSLAEVEVFSGDKNIALSSKVKQSSHAYGGTAELAIDGVTEGDFNQHRTTHTRRENDPWFEIDLGTEEPVDQIRIWNRTDSNLQSRLDGAKVQLLGEDRSERFSTHIAKAKDKNDLSVDSKIEIEFEKAMADFAQEEYPASAAIDKDKSSGWGVGGSVENAHLLTLIPKKEIVVDQPSILTLTIRHESSERNHLLGSFRVEASETPTVADWASLSPQLTGTIHKPRDKRSDEEQHGLRRFFARHFSKSTQSERESLAKTRRELDSLKPTTSVPVLSAVDSKSKRETFIQIRGNYKALGDQVQPGTPAVFHPVQGRSRSELPAREVDRLDFAKWLVDERNPLTARVWMNRMWESLFGIGLVRSSEEFGAQGDLPSHPELLDWLAIEFMQSGWDNKQMLRTIVLSQTYRQTSRVTIEALERDKDNIWLARGPRVRLSAEMVRDQALFAAGLLSSKMHGPPVRPPQPDLGLTAAFGSKTDWKASEGEDRYRRGLYTTWRRSNPYPSMATFDAPSREVCTIRRERTNTPLQALVTLNDPGFVEAAQGLARRVVLYEPSLSDDRSRVELLFSLATSRSATEREIETLLTLLHNAKKTLGTNLESALKLATEPLGELPEDADPAELAAYTTLGNVLLNLDEVLMKR